MRNRYMSIAITGMGIISPIGIGQTAFVEGLKTGQTNFSTVALNHQGRDYNYPSALVAGFDYKKAIEQLPLPEVIKKQAKRLRNISTGAKLGIYTAMNAWQSANLWEADVSRDRIAIVASGSNTQQASLEAVRERYREKLNFLNPTYGYNFLDTDIVGTLSELLQIKGEGHNIGAASASGNMALIQGYRLIESGEYDIVLVVAPAMELSIYEYQGFTALGAMAVPKQGQSLDSLCSPFDHSHCGFVYGQNAGTIIMESIAHAENRKAKCQGYMSGYGCSMDSNRNPNPSIEGETRAMQNALNKATLSIQQIDYINTHGTASVIGDKTEVEAILSIGAKDVKTNATKGLIGHGITSAGLVEAIASIVQMQEGFLHPTPNLIDPIDRELDWISSTALSAEIQTCMSNSFGFGGINTSIILQK